ncbi:hypothetical protein MRX96_004001 [Rhipicephalus microplus]
MQILHSIGVIRQNPLYKFNKVRFEPRTFEHVTDKGKMDENMVDKLVDVDSFGDQMQCVVAMDVSSLMVVYDETCLAGLESHAHISAITLGEGQGPSSVLYNSNAKDSFKRRCNGLSFWA